MPSFIIKFVFLLCRTSRVEFYILNVSLLLLNMSVYLSGGSMPSCFISYMGVCFIILTLWLAGLMIKAVPIIKNKKEFILVMVIIILTLCISFYIDNFLLYYIWFEISLIPIFIIILGWGYQPERILASIIIFFYTISASLPLLLCLIYSIGFLGSLNYSCIAFSFFNARARVSFFLVSGFIVKLPSFGFHLWLPKAHVEAPVIGSIILAGVLLKLGGYGLILSRLFTISEKVMISALRLALVGGMLSSILITSLSDIKVIIAYSSIVHMGMVVSIFLLGWAIGMWGCLLILIRHGFTSSGIFYVANLLYLRSHSRRLVLNKGLITTSARLTIIWFILIIMNFAGPFTCNLLREIIMIISLINLRYWNIVVVAVYCFFSLVYNLLLYSCTQQGVQSHTLRGVNTMNRCEYLISFSHVWTVFLLGFAVQF